MVVDHQKLIQIIVPIVAAELDVASLLEQINTALGTWIVAIYPANEFLPNFLR